MAQKPKFTVIRDTREQKGWTFEETDHCAGTLERKLDTGDYSLLGYEDQVAIERKGAVTELVGNITQKEKWASFQEELQRLQQIPVAFVLCEFNFDDVMRYPMGLPWAVQRKIKVKPQFYLRRLLEIELEFKVGFRFLGPNRGKDFVLSLFKRIVDKCLPRN